VRERKRQRARVSESEQEQDRERGRVIQRASVRKREMERDSVCVGI